MKVQEKVEVLDVRDGEGVDAVCDKIMAQLKILPNDSVILHEILAFADGCLCSAEHPPAPISEG